MVHAQLFDPARGPLAHRVRVDHQRQQHIRVVALAAHPTGLAACMKLCGVQLVDHIEDEPDQMRVRQPVSHVRRQEKHLITHYGTIGTSHTT